MATLIPALSACTSRMTSGERRVAQRLEDKLDDDYLLWYDVPMGPKNAHPDFCVMHPRRGILVLEVKDWKLSTIQQADKQTWEIIPDGIPKSVINPLEQARQYAHQVVNALERDAQLVQADGAHAGKLAFPWIYGVVFTNITRKQFEAAELHQRQMPIEMRRSPGDFDPTSDTIKVMTMKVSNGLEFPVMALPGVGHMPAPGEDEKEAARATQRLLVTVSGDCGFGARLGT